MKKAFLAIFAIITMIMIALATAPKSPSRFSAEKEAEFEQCWRERQYRAAVRSGKWGLEALNSVDMQPIYRECLILQEYKRVKPTSETVRS